MLRKLISESYWLENSQLDDLYNFGFNYFCRRFLSFFFFLSSFMHFLRKLHVGDFKLESILGQNWVTDPLYQPGKATGT